MTTALILGTLHGQVDAIEALQRRGLAVHACGHERVGPGVDAADQFWRVDITDVGAVQRLAEDISADIVYSVGSDIAMPTVVAVSEALGLPHFHSNDLTAVLRDKRALRERLAVAGISPVRHRAVGPNESVIDWLQFPAIVKPVDAQGQRGITVVEDASGFDVAVDRARSAARSGAAIVEEYLRGPEISAHVFVENGSVVFFLPSDRHVWDGPMVGVPRAHSLPLSRETSLAHDDLRRLVVQCVEALGVVDGPLYFQMILTADGPRVVEIASRLDGCHLWRIIKLSTGFDFMDAVLGRLLGEPWPVVPEEPEAEPMTLEFFLGSPDAVVTDSYVASAAKDGALFVDMQVTPGEHPRGTNDVVARLGYEIYRGA